MSLSPTMDIGNPTQLKTCRYEQTSLGSKVHQVQAARVNQHRVCPSCILVDVQPASLHCKSSSAAGQLHTLYRHVLGSKGHQVQAARGSHHRVCPSSRLVYVQPASLHCKSSLAAGHTYTHCRHIRAINCIQYKQQE